MNNLIVSILESCFLNCYSMATNVLVLKLDELTHHKYDIQVLEDSNNKIAFLLDDVTITFNINNRHIITSIECDTNITRKVA